jgi:hypothetical protein
MLQIYVFSVVFIFWNRFSAITANGKVFMKKGTYEAQKSHLPQKPKKAP